MSSLKFLLLSLLDILSSILSCLAEPTFNMFYCIESDMYLFGQSNSPSPQERNRVVTPSSSQSDEPIYIYDSDTDSSATIDNDPDSRYYLDDQEEVVDITGPDTRNLAGANSSETEQAEDDREIVDLTTADFNFDEGDYLTDDHFTWLLRNWNESSEQTTSAPEPEPQQPEKRILPDACVDGIIYRAGQSAELHDGSFLRIHAVLEDDSGEIFFRGPRLFKITDGSIDTCIPIWPNEVLWVIKKDINEDVPFHLIKHFCVVHFTNWPISIGDTARHGGLFCRLKQTVISGRQGAEEGSVEFLTPDEADDGFKYPPTLLRQIWRGTTQPFGDAEIRMSQPSQVIDLEGDSMVIDLTEPEGRTDQQRQQRRYTFGDGFCGAGGVSRGAKTAGLEIKWAFDKGAHAMNSYRLNFSTASCEQTDIFTFLTNDSKYLRVDVSHGSPPCQTFSPAHTVESANDDANSACIFSCADLIRKAKPRIHTMEETCGLSERHTATFFSVVQGFVEIGYSVRWKVMNCMDYGVPQSRRRLIIIASGYAIQNSPFFYP